MDPLRINTRPRGRVVGITSQLVLSTSTAGQLPSRIRYQVDMNFNHIISQDNEVPYTVSSFGQGGRFYGPYGRLHAQRCCPFSNASTQERADSQN